MQIIGICRFSFFGHTDTKLDYSEKERAFERLYDHTRMMQRFFFFENMLLRSMAHQTDPDFTFLVLTSEVMPKEYRDRLHAICAPYPHVQVLLATSENINDALRPYLREFADGGTKEYVQFRIDDDDCLSVRYVETLRRLAENGGPNRIMSFPRGLMLRKSEGNKGMVEACFRRYTGAGFAYHSPANKVRHVYNFAHNLASQRYVSSIDPSIHAYIQCFHGQSDTLNRANRRIEAYALARNRKQRMQFNEDELPGVMEQDYPFMTADELRDIGSQMS